MPMSNTRTGLRRIGGGKDHRDLARSIEAQIDRAAHGRIRDLRVIYSDEEIIPKGHTRTQRAKQLALQAVLELIDGDPLLANQIVVS